MNETIANKLKEAREQRNLTQKQVASALGHKTSNAVSEIERGKVQISAADLYILADLLDKPIPYFFGVEFGDQEIEDLIAIISQLTSDEREQLKRLATSLMNMKLKLVEVERDPSDSSKRELLEDLYQYVIDQMMPLSHQLAAANELKEQLESELGIGGTSKSK
ncbi:MAG: XRE family transcriptional regulator [Chloroflexi bacterium]|nr:MAG: XRE family transcriptional regulator [Chloroflexota bacterium]